MVIAFTRHNSEFDIFTKQIDPAKSRWETEFPDWKYAKKVASLYEKLGVESALWAYPETQQSENWEQAKPIEYELRVDVGRVVGYVDESIWWQHVSNAEAKPGTFHACSREPDHFLTYSLLIATPLQACEVRWRREYCNNHGKRRLKQEIRGSDLDHNH